MNVQRFKSGELQLAYRLVNSGRPKVRGLRQGQGQGGQTQGSVPGSVPKSAPSSVPLVFVHGLLSFSYDWVPVAAALGREAACLDLRGFGDSDWSGDYSVPAMAADLGALLDHLGWKRALLVGHALGAALACYFASRRARRVAGLVLVDYAPEYAAEGVLGEAARVAAVPEVFASIDEAMAHFKAAREARVRFAAYLLKVEDGYAVKRDPWFREQCRRLLAAGAPAKPRVDMWAALARLRVPTLVIRGARSELFAAPSVDKLKAANPAIRLLEVNAGHNVAAENIAGLVAALRPFVASLEGTGRAPAR